MLKPCSPWIPVVVIALLPGCVQWHKVTGQEKKAKAQEVQQVQTHQQCQRFADRYAGKVIETIGPLRKEAANPALSTRLLSWEMSQLNAAYTIATGPSPIVCQLDFVVLASLSRMVSEDSALPAYDSEIMAPIARVYRDLEQEAWDDAKAILTPAQVAELEGLIVRWREKNPHDTLVGFVQFSEFAQGAGWSEEASRNAGGLFGLIRLDPLSGLDPAVRQLEQTRLLAERVIFYMQRMPYLLDLQSERIVEQATMAPAVERTNASLERASRAMAEYARLGASLPDALAAEREALIRQLSGEMLRQEKELVGLLTSMQSTLAAGSETAVAVGSTVEALDRLMARFPAGEPGAEAAPGKPFDITEYTAAATEFTATARQLTVLLETLGRDGTPVAQAVAGGVAAGREVVDHLFWRALQLGLLLIAGGLVAALAYRLASRRIGA